jgi:hypothetical protein
MISDQALGDCILGGKWLAPSRFYRLLHAKVEGTLLCCAMPAIASSATPGRSGIDLRLGLTVTVMLLVLTGWWKHMRTSSPS